MDNRFDERKLEHWETNRSKGMRTLQDMKTASTYTKQPKDRSSKPSTPNNIKR